MLLKEAGPRDWAHAEPVPSARAVSVLSATPITYVMPTARDRRRYGIAALLLGFVSLTVAVVPLVFGLNGWVVSSIGLTAVLFGGVAMHKAPFLGSFGRIAATLGMTMGLAASTLMLYPFL
jgi:hypothetical protein